jgi:NAD(P)H-dependent flavin oxidoreductase YrpB (nitropropane dioxygenase family)
MLETPLCDLLGIDVPIILAPMGTYTSGELAAAVSNRGGGVEQHSGFALEQCRSGNLRY